MSPRARIRARWQASLSFVGSLVVWYYFRGIVPAVIVTGTLVLATLAWVAPQSYKPVQRGLDLVTRGIMTVFSWLTLGLVYFGLFTPLRAWQLITRQDSLGLRPIEGISSYLIPVSAQRERHFDRQF